MVAHAEAAFIADISDRDINRIIDEHLLPDTLYEQDQGRRFWKLGCAFARFYFFTDKALTKTLRNSVISEMTDRILQRQDKDRFLSLSLPILHDDWQIKVSFGTLDLESFVVNTQQRARLVDRAYSFIISDPEIMGGEPVFKGTRVPVYNVAASLKLGLSGETILESYPSLDKGMLNLAEIYAEVHPRRGRPKKVNELNPDWVKISSKIVKAKI